MTDTNGRLVVFARAPETGRVKTRLAADIGDDAAYRAYCAMLEHTLGVATRAGMAEVLLYVHPDIQSTPIQALSNRYPIRLHRQQGDDLGARMAHAITEQLEGAGFVVLIGTDCPLIDEQYLERAAGRLRNGASLVFGPADDGGYVLVGMRQPFTAVFEGIDWGAATVMAQSRLRCRQRGWCMDELPTLFDIDTVDDWQRLHTRYPDIAARLEYFNEPFD